MKTINSSLNAAIDNVKESVETLDTTIKGFEVKDSMATAVDNTKNSSLNEFKSKHDYILGSHNTMSYLKPKNWFYKIFAFTARCQSKSIQDQYYIYDVRLFDLRFKFNKKGEVSFAHGAVEYEGNIEEIMNFLNSLNNIPVRIMLENKPGDKENEFKAWCEYLKNTYKNIRFFGGRNKWSWEELYKFDMAHPSLEDKYSSCNTNEPGKPQTGTYLDDLCPIIYAKQNNKKNLAKGTDKDYLMIDFVEIR